MAGIILANEIQALEESLLHTDFRHKPQLLDDLLCVDFEEIGPTGSRSNRQAVVAWLLNKDTDARWQFEDFKIRELSNTLVLACYRAQQIKPEPSTSKGSIRTSIWKRSADSGHWQMVFHQATKILQD